MKLVHHITVSVFIKPEEEAEPIERAFFSLFPFDLEAEKVPARRTRAESFGGRRITILEATLQRAKHTTAFLSKLRDSLNEEQRALLLAQDNRLDEHLTFYIRLDKPKLLEGRLWITESGDCFHLKMPIAAFPHREEAARRILTEIFK